MIYFDISNLYKTRLLTGIQRVVREILLRALDDSRFSNEIGVIAFDARQHDFCRMNQDDVRQLLRIPKTTEVKVEGRLDLGDIRNGDVFFDLDAVWNMPLKRPYLYRRLKEQQAQIFTLIYDLVPLKFPQFAHQNTLRNFATFMSAVYSHCDLAFMISRSSERDFLEIADEIGARRNIPTVVTKLGSDFLADCEHAAAESSQVDDYAAVLDQKFLLFVGTLEPRKKQELAIDAFSTLAEEHSDLHLVLIGKQGWLVDRLIEKVQSHPLFGKRLHWFDSVNDAWLRKFYENAYIAIYCSSHEGFGLPIAESLAFGIPTVCSKNSSMYEVGKDYADYLVYNARIELVEVLDMYLKNEMLYEQKRAQIQSGFKPYCWDDVYEVIAQVLNRYPQSQSLLRRSRGDLQHVLISIRPKSAARLIEACDEFVGFVKEYVIITRPDLMDRFRRISSRRRIIVIDESRVLGDRLSEFKQAGHQKKNWMLRSSLMDIESLDDEFVMLDDDNIPIRAVGREHFKDASGRYRAYYFQELPEWRFLTTDYDHGQYATHAALDERTLELLSYSSHCPQIINKLLFREASQEFSGCGPETGLDEWSIYFNYAVTRYPALFRKSPHKTLNWPDTPYHWRGLFDPPDYVFENYYSWVYDGGLFRGLGRADHEEKVRRKRKQLLPYQESEQANQAFLPEIQAHDLVHGDLAFEQGEVTVHVAGVPYIVFLAPHAVYHLDLNYKICGQRSANDEFRLIVRRGLHSFSDVRLRAFDTEGSESFEESRVSLPIRSGGAPKTQDLYLSVEKNGRPMGQFGQEYILKLFILKPGESGHDQIDTTS